MPSTSKTDNLSLNQWAASDGVCREDFNADNAIIDTAISAVPIVKLKEVTTSAAASSVELDLSDIDMTEYSEIWIDVRLGVSYYSNASTFFRLNNISSTSYCITLANASQLFCSSGNSNSPLYSGLNRFRLGDLLSWISPHFFQMGYISAVLTPANWTSITFYLTSGAIPAGGTIKLYGVKR